MQKTRKVFAEHFYTSENTIEPQTCKGREEGGFSHYPLYHHGSGHMKWRSVLRTSHSTAMHKDQLTHLCTCMKHIMKVPKGATS